MPFYAGSGAAGVMQTAGRVRVTCVSCGRQIRTGKGQPVGQNEWTTALAYNHLAPDTEWAKGAFHVHADRCRTALRAAAAKANQMSACDKCDR